MSRRGFLLGFLAAALVAGALTPLLDARAQAPSAANPHGDLRLDCGRCHTPEGWVPLRKPPDFAHSEMGFPLEGAHAQASCRDCHQTLVFANVRSACADCHRDAHRGELGGQCETCHTTLTWSNQREMFRVHSRTRFPLLAAHATLDCEACHAGQRPQQFRGTPTECRACHLPDFQGTRDPDHVRLGFSQRCEDCHGAAARSWEGSANFAHPATFPLRGGHANVPCATCHPSGFAGTSSACVSCHRDDYDRTRNPNHRAAGFPTTCQSCHTIDGWPGARFDHDRFFPIDSGPHRGVWPSCSTCHVNPGSFQVFECTTCHEHSREEMDDKHDDVGGYQYRSAACYQCHPRGVE